MRDEYPKHLCFAHLNVEKLQVSVNANDISTIGMYYLSLSYWSFAFENISCVVIILVAVNADGSYKPTNTRIKPRAGDKALILEVKKRPALYRDILLVAGLSFSELEAIWIDIAKAIPGKV